MRDYNNSPRTEIITYSKQSPTVAPRVLYLEPLNKDSSWGSNDQAASFNAWGVIANRWPWLLAMLLVGTAVGLGISLSETPLYQSKVSLEIQNPNEGPINLPMADLQAEASSPESYLPTQSVILESRTLHNRVLAKLAGQKFDRTEVKGSLVGRLLHRKTEITAASAKDLSPVETKVDVEPNTRIVNVSIDSPDPQMAARYANTLANEYIDSNLQARWDAINHARDWLAQQVAEARAKLDESENKLTEYQRASDLMFVSDKESAAQDKLKEVQAALSEAQAHRIEAQSAYQTALSTPSDAVPQVQDNARLNQYQTQLAELRRQLAELSSQYTPNHPKVQKVQAQITQLEASFATERQNILARIRSEYQAAQMRENLLVVFFGNSLSSFPNRRRNRSITRFFSATWKRIGPSMIHSSRSQRRPTSPLRCAEVTYASSIPHKFPASRISRMSRGTRCAVHCRGLHSVWCS